MKFLLLAFITVSPAYACKLAPKSALRSEKSAALAIVKSKHKSRDLKVRRMTGHYLVRSSKPSCIDYKIEINRTPDCKMHPEIVSEGPCP